MGRMAGTNFHCSSLTSFPLLNTAAGTNFLNAWFGCSSLTSFPLLNTAAGRTFSAHGKAAPHQLSAPTQQRGRTFRPHGSSLTSLTQQRGRTFSRMAQLLFAHQLPAHRHSSRDELSASMAQLLFTNQFPAHQHSSGDELSGTHGKAAPRSPRSPQTSSTAARQQTSPTPSLTPPSTNRPSTAFSSVSKVTAHQAAHLTNRAAPRQAQQAKPQLTH
jgi:hypothetical protein